MRRGFWIALLGAVLAVPVRAEFQVVDVPPEGVELGLGWDSSIAEVRPARCIRFAPVQEGGQTLTLDFSEVSDSSELATSLDVSGSSSIRVLGGSASASAEFVHESKINAASTNLALRAAVQNGAMFAGPWRPVAERRFAFSATSHEKVPLWMRGPADPSRENDSVLLSDWALEILRRPDQGAAEFRRHCGDHFVKWISSGAEILAVFSFQSESKTDSDSLTLAVEGEYSGVSASGDLDLDTDATAVASRMKVSYIQVGGAEGEIPTSNEDLKRRLAALASEAAEAPEFYEMGVVPYTDLPNYPESSVAPTSTGRVNDILSRRDLELASLYASIGAIVETRGDYKPEKELFAPRIALLRVLQDRILRWRDLIAKIQRFRSRYERAALDQRPTPDLGPFAALAKQARSLAPEATSPLEPPEDAGYDALLDLLTGVVERLDVDPWRLRLSPPKRLEISPGPGWAETLVEFYLGRSARRACRRGPHDPGCLTNAQLDAYVDQVVPDYALARVPLGAPGFLFSGDAERKGCLHLTGEATETSIRELSNETRVRDLPCTALTFSRTGADGGHLLLAADTGEVLTRDRAALSLAARNPAPGSGQEWKVRQQKMLESVGSDSQPTCLTSEPGMGFCENPKGDTRLWFFVRRSIFEP